MGSRCKGAGCASGRPAAEPRALPAGPSGWPQCGQRAVRRSWSRNRTIAAPDVGQAEPIPCRGCSRISCTRRRNAAICPAALASTPVRRRLACMGGVNRGPARLRLTNGRHWVIGGVAPQVYLSIRRAPAGRRRPAARRRSIGCRVAVMKRDGRPTRLRSHRRWHAPRDRDDPARERTARSGRRGWSVYARAPRKCRRAAERPRESQRRS
jgi:hypothetical protein